jgi:hypothetical protein
MELKIMTKAKISLTHEALQKRFDSQFDLVSYAISLAKEIVHSGHELPHHDGVLNLAHQILELIAEHKDTVYLPKEEEPQYNDFPIPTAEELQPEDTVEV